MVCPLAPLPDEFFIKAAVVKTTERRLISIFFDANPPVLVLALTAVSIGGMLVQTTVLLATPMVGREQSPWAIIFIQSMMQLTTAINMDNDCEVDSARPHHRC